MAKNTLEINMYRYNPEKDNFPYMMKYQIEKPHKDIMVLDLLHLLKEQDDSISYRRSCREGVCGSDGMNINGKNGLACITPISSVVKKNKIELRPLPGLPVIRDLVVDMTEFYAQYEKIKPFLQNSTTAPEQERLQSPEDRDKLDGLYECILCACCSTSCPSFWWNPDKFLGPAALLQAYRFLADTRDLKTNERLEELSDPFSVYRCHGIMNCVSVCPKGLNPNKAIGEIKSMLLKDKNEIIEVKGPFTSNNLSSVLAAARAGMGLAAVPWYVAHQSVKDKALKPVMQDWSLPTQEIHAVFSSPKHVPTKVSQCIDWLQGQFKGEWWKGIEAGKSE
jgi:succinate dehydrogenase / fumarate reductase iron-sulfur subunit